MTEWILLLNAMILMANSSKDMAFTKGQTCSLKLKAFALERLPHRIITTRCMALTESNRSVSLYRNIIQNLAERLRYLKMTYNGRPSQNKNQFEGAKHDVEKNDGMGIDDHVLSLHCTV